MHAGVLGDGAREWPVLRSERLAESERQRYEECVCHAEVLTQRPSAVAKAERREQREPDIAQVGDRGTGLAPCEDPAPQVTTENGERLEDENIGRGELGVPFD